MSFTCAIQMTGLIRGESKAEHRSNGKAILGEMGKERISLSETFNPDRTPLNVYEQEEHSGFAMWDSMEYRANTYRQEVKGKTKNGDEITRYRSLRKDAVIGAAIIINPPYEECRNWSEEEYQKFYDDTRECLAEFRPEIFRRTNQVFGVEHRDEGYDDNDRHLHAVYDAVDEDGRYCGNKLDPKFLSDFNKSYPKMMRSKGWEMDDLDTTDWERYKSDSTYRKERNTKRRSQGKSVNQHIRNKTAENLKKSDEILKEAQQMQDDAEEQQRVQMDAIRQREIDLDEREAEIRRKESLIETRNAQAKGDALQASKKLSEAKLAYDKANETLGEVYDVLGDVRILENDMKSSNDSAKLQRALKFMKTCTLPNSTTTALASFEAKERLSGHTTKSKHTRAQLATRTNNLYDRIKQKRQHSDDGLSY